MGPLSRVPFCVCVCLCVCVCAVCCRCRRAPSLFEHVQDFSFFGDEGHWFRVSDFAQRLGVEDATVVEAVRRHLVKDRGGARFGLCSLGDEWYVQACRCVLCARCLVFRRWSLSGLALILGRRRPSEPRRLHSTGCDTARFLLMTSPSFAPISSPTSRWRARRRAEALLVSTIQLGPFDCFCACVSCDRVCFCLVWSWQARLSAATPVVQCCVIFGPPLVTDFTRSAAACLVVAVRRVNGILRRLGALLC